MFRHLSAADVVTIRTTTPSWRSATAGSTARCPQLTSASSSAPSRTHIAAFPPAAQAVVKDRVNAIALAPADDSRRDSDLFLEGAGDPEAQSRMGAALKHGLQSRGPEIDLAGMLGELAVS
jgi:hypothetical protein